MRLVDPAEVEVFAGSPQRTENPGDHHLPATQHHDGTLRR